MATVQHVTSGLGLRKFQADGFLLTRVYKCHYVVVRTTYSQINHLSIGPVGWAAVVPSLLSLLQWQQQAIVRHMYAICHAVLYWSYKCCLHLLLEGPCKQLGTPQLTEPTPFHPVDDPCLTTITTASAPLLFLFLPFPLLLLLIPFFPLILPLFLILFLLFHSSTSFFYGFVHLGKKCFRYFLNP